MSKAVKQYLKRISLRFFRFCEGSPRRYGDAIATLYHEVGDQPSDYAVTRSVFAAQIGYLAEQGDGWLTATSLAEQLSAGSGSRGICVTFDDGDRSAFQPTLDLVEAGGKCTHFIIPERIRQHDRRSISWAQVRELDRAGVEIGSHSLTHAWLTRLTEPELKTELTESKKIIEDELGKPVTSFAYPYGDFDRRVAEQVRESGYLCAFTTRHLYATQQDDVFRLPRFEPLESLQQLADLHRGHAHHFYRLLRAYLQARDRVGI